MIKIKICGLTTAQDVQAVNEIKADFAGMVLFYPKSRRNITVAQAKSLLALLSPSVKPVAVTVSPTVDELRLIEAAGFSYIQIHGQLSEEVINAAQIPILRGFNGSSFDTYADVQDCAQIAGFVFDAAVPGSGATFDWTLLRDLLHNADAAPDDTPSPDHRLLLLAGGLNAGNVADAIRTVRPDGVDVSSGVETEGVPGKDVRKIRAFADAVRSCDI